MKKGYTTLIIAMTACLIAGNLIARGDDDDKERGRKHDKGDRKEHREEMDKLMNEEGPVAACKEMLKKMEERHDEMQEKSEERFEEMLKKMKERHEEMQEKHEEAYKERVALLKELISKGDDLTKEDVKEAMKAQAEKMKERHQKMMEERKKNCDKDGDRDGRKKKHDRRKDRKDKSEDDE